MRGFTKLQSLWCWTSNSKTLHIRLLTSRRFATVAKPSQLKKKKKKKKKKSLDEGEEASSFGSLFNEITEILGDQNVTADKAPSGIFISKKTHLGIGEIVCNNAGEVAPDEEGDVTVAVEADEAEVDVSPLVHEVTKIVRAESGLVKMEDELDKLGFQLDSEIVDKVLKRCFKVPHFGLRFFDWVKLREGYFHSTGTYNTVLCVAGEVKEFGLAEKLVEEMETTCEKDIKTWTILIKMYGKARLVGKALLVYEDMKKCGFEPDGVIFRTMIRALCAAGKADVAMEFYKEMVRKDFGLDINLYKLLLNGLARSGDTAAMGVVSDDMMRVSQIPENVVYGCVLKSLCISGRIRDALGFIRELKNKEVMISPGYFETLVRGLCRADRIADALEILEIMKKKDFVDGNVYGIIINGYLRKNDVCEALDLFRSMKEAGYFPTTSTYTELMQHFFNVNDYRKGCELYEEMLERGVELDSVAVTALVAGHVRQNQVSDAWKVFNSMKDRGIKPTLRSYSSFIKELCKISRTDEILKVLIDMRTSNMQITDDIFHCVVHLMEKMGDIESLEKVKQMSRLYKLHPLEGEVSGTDASTGERTKTVLESKYVVPEKMNQPLSNAYDEKDLQDICKILSSSTVWCSIQEALESSVVDFTPNLVLEILRNSSTHGSVALQFFSWVGKQSGYCHTAETYNMAIKISGRGKDFKHMRNLFHEMRRNGFSITADTWTIMIMLYGRTGLTEIALQLFREMKSDCNPSGSTYKYLIISLCGRKGRRVDEAVSIFQEMVRSRHKPDKELLEIYIGCLCEVGRLSDAKQCIDSLSRVGFTTSLSYSLYIRALCRAGRLQEASIVMDGIGEETSTLDQYTYGSFVHGLLRTGQVKEALAKMESMKQAGVKPTVHVYTSLIVHFCKEKQIKRALEVLNQMQEEGCAPTVVTYSALIRGYLNMEMVAEAWDVFHNMKQKGPLPDFRTYSMFLHCLCKAGRSEEAMQLISEMSNSGMVPSVVNFRTVFYGLNREGKQDLARTVMEQKSSLIRRRKFKA